MKHKVKRSWLAPRFRRIGDLGVQPHTAHVFRGREEKPLCELAGKTAGISRKLGLFASKNIRKWTGFCNDCQVAAAREDEASA